MEREGLVALGKLALRQKEHLVALRPVEGGRIMLETLYYPDEIREFDGLDVGGVEVSEPEMQMASALVQMLRAPFDPAAYHDAYRGALMAMITAKLEGRPGRRRHRAGPRHADRGPDGGAEGEHRGDAGAQDRRGRRGCRPARRGPDARPRAAPTRTSEACPLEGSRGGRGWGEARRVLRRRGQLVPRPATRGAKRVRDSGTLALTRGDVRAAGEACAHGGGTP